MINNSRLGYRFWDDDAESKLYTFGSDSKAVLDTFALKQAASNIASLAINSPVKLNFDTNKGDSVKVSSTFVESDPDAVIGEAIHNSAVVKFNRLLPMGYNNQSDPQCALMTFIENRRCDENVLEYSPGYRSYLESYYSANYSNNRINSILENDLNDPQDINSYIYRTLFSPNKLSFNNNLPELQSVLDMVNTENINKLSSSGDSRALAGKVLDRIKKLVNQNKQEQKQNGSGEGDNKDKQEQKDDSKDQSGIGNGNDSGMANYEDRPEKQNQKSGQGNSGNESGNNKEDKKDDSKKDGPKDGTNESKDQDKKDSDKQNDKPGNNQPQQESKPNNPVNVNILQKELQKVNDHTSNSNTSNTITDVNAMDDSSEIKVISAGGLYVESLKVLKITLTENAINTFGIGSKNKSNDSVSEGLILGKKLGSKLKIRDENKVHVTTRQKHGKIDHRLLHEFRGFDNGSVFFTKEEKHFNEKNLYITIDASGSMNYIPFESCLVSSVAIAKAASMVSNVNVHISFRYNINGMLLYVVGYDSRKHKLAQLQLFNYIRATGGTPEGLILEAMKKDIRPSNTTSQSYLINYCDGEPGVSVNTNMKGYNNSLEKYTREQVDEIRKSGVTILGYFIGSGLDDFKVYKSMYGEKDSTRINVTDIIELSNTINKMLLSN